MAAHLDRAAPAWWRDASPRRQAQLPLGRIRCVLSSASGPLAAELLIADEVGLGKTIEAGMVLRQAWLAGRAAHIGAGAEGGPQAVADRTAGEVQPQLAHLRRPSD